MPNKISGPVRKLSDLRIWFSLTLLVTLALAVKLFSYSTYEKKEDEQHQSRFNSDYRIYSLNIPEQVSFAGEEVPLDKLDLLERFDRELLVNTYWQSQTLLFLKRSNKWFPVIEPILKKNGVPEDFKYLCLAESGLQDVVSSAGATGFWQWMKGSGREYGLEIGKEVDERYHLEKSTEASCDYLKKAKEKFGSWTLAAASYNMGIPGMSRQLARQKVKNYYDLLLNTETSRYVFRIVALKEIMSNPDKYGFQFRKKDLYPRIATREITVDTAIADLADFSIQQGVNYKVLKLLNPWLRQSYLTNKDKKTYQIKLPVEEAVERLMVDPVNVEALDSVKTDLPEEGKQN